VRGFTVAITWPNALLGGSTDIGRGVQPAQISPHLSSRRLQLAWKRRSDFFLYPPPPADRSLAIRYAAAITVGSFELAYAGLVSSATGYSVIATRSGLSHALSEPTKSHRDGAPSWMTGRLCCSSLAASWPWSRSGVGLITAQIVGTHVARRPRADNERAPLRSKSAQASRTGLQVGAEKLLSLRYDFVKYFKKRKQVEGWDYEQGRMAKV
jgi:hypothetical protein